MILKVLITTFLIGGATVYANTKDSLKIKNSVSDSLEKLNVDTEVKDTFAKYFAAHDSIYLNFDVTRVHYKSPVDILKLRDTLDFVLRTDSCDYQTPIVGKITSNFGMRRGRYHYGIDVDLVTGDKIKPAFDGVVRFAKYASGYGNVIVVRHFNGLETYYAHLSKIMVKPGDVVSTSDIIGKGGNTGRSTGSHLHFEVRYLGFAMDPKNIINFETGVLLKDNLQVHVNEQYNYVVEMRKRKYYKVRSGDTLSQIARRNGVSLKKVLSLNGLKMNSVIRPGQVIRYN